MTTGEERTILRINKRGFRHNGNDRKFISSRLDWLYTDNARRLANITRLMMQFAVTQSLEKERYKVCWMPHTDVIHTWNSVTKHNTVSERLYLDGDFDISLVAISDVEQEELNNVNRTQYVTSVAYLAKYLENVIENESSSLMVTGGSFSMFLQRLSSLISENEIYVIPLLLTYDNSEDKHSFSITFVPRENQPTHCLKIDVKII